MATASTLAFRNLACLSLFVYNNATVLGLQTLLFLFFQNLRCFYFFQNLRFQIEGAAYLRMRLIYVTVRLLKPGPPRQWKPIRWQNQNNRFKHFQIQHIKCPIFKSGQSNVR